MAASKAFVSLSAVYTSGVVITIDGITDLSASQNGQPVDLLTNAETAVESVFVDGIAADISVTFTDANSLKSIDPGMSGSLVLIFQQRAPGSGAAAGGDLTATAANAVVVDITGSGATTGIGSNTVTFRCAAPDSGDPIAWT